MLPSKIEDFPIFGPSKRPLKFHRFSHRFFIDFGSVLASNMGPSWGPRRSKFEKMASKTRRAAPKEQFLIRSCFWTSFKTILALILAGSRLDFRRFLDDFWRLLAYFWLRNSLSYRNPPYSKNLGGGTPPQGGFNPPPFGDGVLDGRVQVFFKLSLILLGPSS